MGDSTTRLKFGASGHSGRSGRTAETAGKMDDTAEEVFLHIYDLSSGLATQLSRALLGKQVGSLTILCSVGALKTSLPKHRLDNVGTSNTRRSCANPSIHS